MKPKPLSSNNFFTVPDGICGAGGGRGQARLLQDLFVGGGRGGGVGVAAGGGRGAVDTPYVGHPAAGAHTWAGHVSLHVAQHT